MTKTAAYILTDLETEKFYVGSASNVSRRISFHKYQLRRQENGNPNLQEMYDSCTDPEFFRRLEVTIIPAESREAAYDIEQSVIDKYKDSGMLMNIATDARSSGTGRIISEEQRRNTSIRSKGTRHTPEAIEKMSKFQKGKIISKEQKRKISETASGKPKTQEHIDRAARGHFKEVVENGRVYESITAFAREKGVSMMTASRMAKKLRMEEQ